MRNARLFYLGGDPVTGMGGALLWTAEAPSESEDSVSSVAGWLRAAGAMVDAGVAVEINPHFALDAEELATKITPGLHVSQPKYFAPE